MKIGLGEHQLAVDFTASIEGQGSCDMPPRGELSNRVAIEHHFRNGRPLLTIGMGSVIRGQLNGRQQAVIERNRHHTIILLFHRSQEACGGTLEDALNTTLGRTASTAFSRQPHEHTITIPGVIQLVVADVDVITTVIADREAKPFAAAAKSRFDEVIGFAATHPSFRINVQNSEAIQAVQGQIEGLFF